MICNAIKLIIPRERRTRTTRGGGGEADLDNAPPEVTDVEPGRPQRRNRRDTVAADVSSDTLKEKETTFSLNKKEQRLVQFFYETDFLENLH